MQASFSFAFLTKLFGLLLVIFYDGKDAFMPKYLDNAECKFKAS